MQVPAHTMHFEQAGELEPEVRMTGPEEGTKFYKGTDVEFTADAFDYDGNTITEVNFYLDEELIGSDATAPYSYVWSGATRGEHSVYAEVVNSKGQRAVSEPTTFVVNEDTECFQTSNEALQGSFSKGYIIDMSTSGTSVEVEIELLDTDRNGVVAYIWVQQPFSEQMMEQVGNNIFRGTLTGQKVGEKINLAVKFAYAGGMSVTKYFDYTIGNNCTGSSVEVPTTNEITWRVQDGTLYIHSLENQPITVYDLCGALIHSEPATRVAQIKLHRGVYIARIGDLSIKVMNNQ